MAGEASGNDIAIVGMSGRFPGASDVAELWANIRAGRSGISRFTDDELRAAGVSEELLADPAYVKASPVIDGIERFDAGFFGFSPKEAQILDPQHRLFLEHSWEALEDAGCDPTRFDGAVGVFAGSAMSHYLTNNLVPSGMFDAMGSLALGLANDKDSLTTRVSHTLGLSGPSYGVQSYCSTSLVAVCAAATSLANFECDLALAGGVAVNVPQRVGYLYQQGGISPPDGECRPFDAAGLGAPLGSGVAVVALRRLEDALADGDQIYAVIRGWAVNNDAGRKVGFTAPGVQGQAAVVSEALAAAGLDPADIDYVEAHGTGTSLGDASELSALQQVFRGRSCLIGSIKSNLGHLDRAAGATNLIKAALALRFDEIPPSINLSDPNAQLSAGEAELEVVTELRRWPRRDGRIRRAGVSAFGVGGTNAHVVLEEAPPVERPDAAPRAELLVWSARTANAAEQLTERLGGYLETDGDQPLHDVAHTLQSGRQQFTHRRMLVASTAAEAAAALRDGTALGRTDSRTDREVGFLIAGTGEQYPGMAADLYRTEPVFREVLDECREGLRRHLGVDPVEDLLRERETGDTVDTAKGLGALLGRDQGATPDAASSTASATRVLQPALFAVEYALAQTVRSWGVEPTVLAGYSLGEYVAACLAGVLSLPDALALVARRAQLIDALPGGAMGAVPMSVPDVRERLAVAGLTGIDVAAVNGPDLTVIAGDPREFATARLVLEAESVPVRPLATTHAFHSRMLEPIRAELTEWIAANVELHAPTIPYISNVTGEPVTAEQVTDPGYWAEHMCAPVQFDKVLSTLLGDEDLALLEIGPGQSLSAMARGHRDCPPDRWGLVVPSLPGAGDPRQGGAVLAEGIGRLWLAGVPVDWSAYQDGRPVTKIGLPTYPFQRERYWIDPPAGQAGKDAAAAQSAQTTGAGATDSEPQPGHVQIMTPVWTPAEPAERIEPAARCVVLADAGGVADELADTLRRDGTEVVLVPAGSAPAACGPTDDSQVTVVDLRLLDRPDVAEQEALLPAASMLDAWGNGGADSTRIVVVTRGGQVVLAGESPAVGHAGAATLALVANQEYLNLDCRAVDLDPGHCTKDSAAVVAAELRRPSGDVLAAYRGGQRYVREYKISESEPAEPAVAIRPEGTYLVTGALGDVGLIVAEHLARSGAKRLILTSRGGVPDDPADPRHEGVARLRALGVTVDTPRVDVTDADAMRAVVAELTTGGGRLDGVIHAAADTARETFKPLRDLDAETVARHFDAKVGGARVLETVLDELPPGQAPEFCLVFSSTSSILGGITFGSYSAANAALTALGQRNHARHAAGETAVRWVAASWDTWACTLEKLEGGFGAAMVAHSMSTEEALAALDRMLADPRPSQVVAAGGLDDRLPRTAAITDGEPGGGEKFPRPELPQPYSPPMTATERVLAELWSDVLGIEPVGVRDNFFDLGGNSLVALQMLALVKKRFGISVPTVVLFEAPTVNKLAANLDEQGASTAQPAQPARAAGPARTVVKAQPRPAPADGQPQVDRRIAIVGMAGRFPGAPDVSAFWRNLRDGVESIARFSEEELIAAGVDPEHVRNPNYVPARPVLEDISGFDAGFFGMSARMATITDPQQRLFLEVCWEALELSGYAVPEHRGRVGVFGGANLSTYLLRGIDDLLNSPEVSDYEAVMGNDKDALTTMVSYLFDLYGPSVAVQTFCSTSLVAAHLAVQSLRAGDCEMALAGGVSIRIPDRIGHLWGPGGQESMDGHVRTFDAKARGSMFGDGAAVVVLKRLPDALRDGDHIWAVIRGTAMNNDGALKVGYTAPSVVGQSRVVIDAMADAGVTAEDLSYIECHGTATELGDPIEVASLIRAFGPTQANQYCPIGSVKTNIGHLDRAAGASGLIKTSLSLYERMIPPSLHYTSPNPEIDFENSPFYVNAELSPWTTRDGRPRIAGVSSLGMGGTNVHMVLEEAPARPAATTGPDPDGGRRYQALPVSARNAAAADQACQRLGEYLAAEPATRLVDVAYTLQVGRKTFEHRRATVADSLESAAATLTGQGRTPMLSRVDTVQGRQVAFLFAGVGEQYPGLVAELYRREPLFRSALDECLDVLRDAVPADLTDLLTGPRGGADRDGDDPRAAALERTEVVQPALFAVEYALARTLMAWGLRPSVMLGYSLGEYVAACLAGVLSLPDALALVVHRAKLIDALPSGSMVAVAMPVADVTRRFRLEQRGLDIAAVNGPQLTVVAGPAEPMAALVTDLQRANVPCRALQTTHAFHSRMLDECAAELTDWVKNNVTLQAPQLPYLSNVTGELVTADQACDPSYWARHMCRTVQFASAVDTLLADPELAVLEIGPGQSLGALVRGAGCPPQRWPLILHALPAASDTRTDDAALTDCLARLWLVGADLDWPAYHGRQEAAELTTAETTTGEITSGDSTAGESTAGDSTAAAAQGEAAGAALPCRVPLPTYPFQRHRYWIESASGKPRRPADNGGPMGVQEIDANNLFEAFGALPTLPEEQWLYLPVWRQVAEQPPSEQQPGSWLVFSRDGLADQVLAAVRQAAEDSGAAVTVVRPGEFYEPAEDGYTIRPGSMENALAMLRDLREDGRTLDRVVHLWNLEPDEDTIPLGLHTLVALARGASEAGYDGWSLDIVVSGSQEVLRGEVTNPAAATAAGPCLVIPLEHPSVQTRLIDVQADHIADRAADQLGDLIAELRRPLSDRIVALRHGRRWLPDFDQMPSPEADPQVLREGGVYLITGGLGGIALGLAERLAKERKAKLVLLARRGLPPGTDVAAVAAGGPAADALDENTRERVAKVAALIEHGAEVEIVTGDVSDPQDVRRAVEAAIERFGALHGVLHAAGVPGMGLIQFKYRKQLDEVLAPKVGGAKAIAKALRIGEPDEVKLDFLLLFSSMTTATGGGPGQVDYCGANAYLDSYAHQLAATGRRVLAIDWGEWTWNAWEAGLDGYDEGLQKFFRENRARVGLSFDDGWRALLRVLATGQTRVVVSTQHYPTVVMGSKLFTLEAVMAPGAPGGGSGELHPRPELVTAYQEPSGETEEAIAEIWGQTLRLERIGVLDSFFELGGNSLLGVNVVDTVRRKFGLAELPPHILYEAPTVAALAKTVEQMASGGASSSEEEEGSSQVRAQLRRSSLANRRRKQ